MLPLVCRVPFCLFSLPPHVYIASEHFGAEITPPFGILDFWHPLAKPHSTKSLGVAPAWQAHLGFGKRHFWLLSCPISPIAWESPALTCCPPSRTCLWQHGSSLKVGVWPSVLGPLVFLPHLQHSQPLHPAPRHRALARGGTRPPGVCGWGRVGSVAPGTFHRDAQASCYPWEGGGRPGPWLLPTLPSLPGYTNGGWAVTLHPHCALSWCYTKFHCTLS